MKILEYLLPLHKKLLIHKNKKITIEQYVPRETNIKTTV